VLCPYLGEFCSLSFLCFYFFDLVCFSSLARDSTVAAWFSLSAQISSWLRFLLAARKFFDLSILAVSQFLVQRFALLTPIKIFFNDFCSVFFGQGAGPGPGLRLELSLDLTHSYTKDSLTL
jgi:hypothetical protein